MTDRTLFIHAGGLKTGSSAIQNFFEIHALRFEELGFAYENRLLIKSKYAINGGNGLLLYKLLSSTISLDNEIDSLVLSYFGMCSRALCSCESLQYVTPLGWRKLIESTLRLGIKIKVLFYVRNVIPFLLSAYDQLIKRHGEWRIFDEWVLGASWDHFSALRVISHQFPTSNIQILHYDRAKTNLIRGFLDTLGVDPSFKVDSNDQMRQVNRSLTNGERDTLLTVNRFLGKAYSRELSDLLIYANPDALGEPVIFDQMTTDLLLDRFSEEVNWVNKTFFNDQSVVSVLPSELFVSNKSKIKSVNKSEVEKQAFEWALEKLNTIKDETELKILNSLKNATQIDSEKFHPGIPADFDPLAYLVLNPDVLRAGVDPIQHFNNYGKQEGRAYKFIKRRSSI